MARKVVVAETLLVLNLKYGGGIEHQPPDVEEKTAYNSELA